MYLKHRVFPLRLPALRRLSGRQLHPCMYSISLHTRLSTWAFVLVSALFGRTRPEEWTRQTAQVAARVDGSRLEVRQTDPESDVTTVEGARDDDRWVAWDRAETLSLTNAANHTTLWIADWDRWTLCTTCS